jgi:ring-1,2-phenylacetyl-CoA epoxidase subunit PaaD
VVSTVTSALTAERAWEALRAVPDPEIPVISVTELGIVRDVQVSGDTEIVTALRAAGAREVQVRQQLAPAWTTDWIDPAARERLRAWGIVPPGERAPATGVQPIRFVPRTLACPRCGSENTEQLSRFGATACKALYRCRGCGEPFEYFKPI